MDEISDFCVTLDLQGICDYIWAAKQDCNAGRHFH